jgi:hypothetical protein
MFSTILAATAYESGRAAGALFMVVLVAALVHRFLVRDRLPGARGVLAVTVVAVVAGYFAVKSETRTDPEQVRADMVAGCQSSAGPGASLCGCVVDELRSRTGTSQEALDRLDEEMRTWQARGGQPPADFNASAQACKGQTVSIG